MKDAYALGVNTGERFVMPPYIIKGKEAAIEKAKALEIVAKSIRVELEDDLEMDDAPTAAVGILTDNSFKLISFCETIEDAESYASELLNKREVRLVALKPNEPSCEIDCREHGACEGLALEVTDQVVWRSDE